MGEYARGLHAKQISPEEKEALSTRITTALGMLKKVQRFSDAWKEGSCDRVLAAAADIPAAVRPDHVQLMISRCYAQTGKTKEAISSITRLLNNCDKSGSWSKENAPACCCLWLHSFASHW